MEDVIKQHRQRKTLSHTPTNTHIPHSFTHTPLSFTYADTTLTPALIHTHTHTHTQTHIPEIEAAYAIGCSIHWHIKHSLGICRIDSIIPGKVKHKVQANDTWRKHTNHKWKDQKFYFSILKLCTRDDLWEKVVNDNLQGNMYLI